MLLLMIEVQNAHVTKTDMYPLFRNSACNIVLCFSQIFFVTGMNREARIMFLLLAAVYLIPIIYGSTMANINETLDWSKLRAHADDKINVTQRLIFVSSRLETIKRET